MKNTILTITFLLFLSTISYAQQGKGKKNKEAVKTEKQLKAKGPTLKESNQDATTDAKRQGKRAQQEVRKTEQKGQNSKQEGKQAKQKGQNSKQEGKKDRDQLRDNKKGKDGDRDMKMKKDKKGKDAKDQKGNAYGKNKQGLKGKEFGQERARQAKQNRELKERELHETIGNGDSRIVTANDRIRIAKEKLEKDKKEGSVKEEDYKIRQEKIEKAEKGVESLKERLMRAKEIMSPGAK